jgi:hypothetical protein
MTHKVERMRPTAATTTAEKIPRRVIESVNVIALRMEGSMGHAAPAAVQAGASGPPSLG